MTIRRRIFLSFLALLVVPVLFIGLAMAAVRGYYEGRNGEKDTGRTFSDSYEVLLGTLNTLILENPESLLDPHTLSVFASDRPFRGAAVLRDGRLASGVPAVVSLEAVRQAEEAGLWRGFESLRRHSGYYLLFRWNFAFSDGLPGTFLLIGRGERFFGGHAAGPLFLLFLAGMLFLVNGGITWLASRKIVGPLIRLEDAAREIGEGDLSRPLIPAGDRELKRVFDAFETMRSRLKAALDKQLAYERGRRELIASLSHDLRTPITAIRGYVEGLRDGIPKNEDARRKYLATIDEKARLLDRLIGDLFLISRLDLPDYELRKESISLQEFAGSVIEEYHEEHPDLSFRWGRRDTCAVFADRDHLRRALVNICENSLRHSGLNEPVLELSVEALPGFCRIGISDNGKGIGRGEEERIFEGMYRGDASRNQRDGGSGLGLTVVRQVAEAHGGRAWAESRHSGGLTIVLEFPAGPPSSEGHNG